MKRNAWQEVFSWKSKLKLPGSYIRVFKLEKFRNPRNKKEFAHTASLTAESRPNHESFQEIWFQNYSLESPQEPTVTIYMSTGSGWQDVQKDTKAQ